MRISFAKKTAFLLVAIFVGSAALSAQGGAPAQETATQFYMKYLAAMAKAKRVEDIYPYMAEKTRKEAEAEPAGDRAKMFELIKMMSFTNVKVTKEERNASGAILTAEGLDPMEKKKGTGKITIVREGGAWKLGGESWGN